jgi:hypothetical protein
MTSFCETGTKQRGAIEIARDIGKKVIEFATCILV